MDALYLLTEKHLQLYAAPKFIKYIIIAPIFQLYKIVLNLLFIKKLAKPQKNFHCRTPNYKYCLTNKLLIIIFQLADLQSYLNSIFAFPKLIFYTKQIINNTVFWSEKIITILPQLV